jgi:DNA-directed RNA polymerase subunit RPC12/RpoP
MADVVNQQKRCPACGSETLARMHRTWWQRIAGWTGDTRKYRCLFCGFEFLEKTRETRESQHSPPAGP